MQKTGATINLTTGAHNWESRRRHQRSSMRSAARYHQCERHDRGSGGSLAASAPTLSREAVVRTPTCMARQRSRRPRCSIPLPISMSRWTGSTSQGSVRRLCTSTRASLLASTLSPDTIAWQVSGANTFVYVNTSSAGEPPGHADMEIVLNGKLTLTESNFAHH